ncbi:tetratricopeptide repeat protein [Streptomyces sp. NBC_01356]|uniref:tetratricopeptide repeat protein n=1 Tax=Streptomyces sp. NBC_01356 TaxID=2903836 RepID=UPI002E3040DB|nr:tetratricopeptide repeat protein [Streptomyces sp. NBC_01356]
MSVRCPVVLCREENAYGTEVCAGCRTPLSGYARLHTYPAYLFNQGLAAAREGRLTAARDCFAAVVHWCPGDTEARNALALAGLRLGDRSEAHRQWTEVLGRRPDDPKATWGLAQLAEPSEPAVPAESSEPAVPSQPAEPAEPAEPSGISGPGEVSEPAPGPG